MLESLMEDLLWRYPADFFPRYGFKPIARQFTLSDGGRLDISFRDSTDRLWVVEVKAVPIRTEVADQVYRYARRLREAHPQDPPIPAVVAPVINATVRDHFDRWGIEYFEIGEAVFRRVANERGEDVFSQQAEPVALAAAPSQTGSLGPCGNFKTTLGYARFCQRGMCESCNYRSCECPHHSGGVADPQVVRNCREWEAPGAKWWMTGCCQVVQHANCHNPSRCGCQCHVTESEATTRAVTGLAQDTLTDTRQLHLDFWTQFHGYMKSRSPAIEIDPPSPHHYLHVRLARTKSTFFLSLVNDMRRGRTRLEFDIYGPRRSQHYALLRTTFKDEIEAKLGSVEWNELAQVKTSRKTTPADRATWPDLNAWLGDEVERWVATLKPIVASLGATDVESQ